MNSQLEFQLRKSKGKSKLAAYNKLFLDSGFKEGELTYIGLEEADKLIEMTRSTFADLKEKSELVPGNAQKWEDSTLLSAIMLENSNESVCYIFTTDYEYCGIYLVSLRRALELALIIAKKDFQNLLFIIDKDFKYSISIHYNDESHIDKPINYDIQIKRIS